MDDDRFSRDTLFSGRLICLQHRKGYRFSLDAVLLAHFFRPKAGERILDLGAGCGVVSLILAYRWPEIELTALEIQSGLVELIRRNVELNRLGGRLHVVEGDCRRIDRVLKAGSFDRAVCNPPYRRAGTGRRNPGEEPARARHEFLLDLAGAVRAAAFALRTRGRAVFVYPAARAGSLLFELKNHGLEPKRLQVVYSYPGGPGRLVLVEAVKNGGEELAILPPFFVYQEPGGAYSGEMGRCYAP